mgnify:FL=1
MNKDEIIKKLEEFQQLLFSWEQHYLPQTRSSINKNIPFVQKILHLTGTHRTITVAPPPMIGGLVMKNVDPFTCIYDPPYGLSVIDMISDSIDEAIGVIDGDKDFVQKLNKENLPKQKIKNSLVDSKKVFIVHGRDNELKETTARFLEKLGLNPIILHEQVNNGKTIIEKFEDYADVGFAIILMTPDDMGCLSGEQDSIKLRARQNVIFEHGYFIGKLGRNKVTALVKGNIELPTDINGILYVAVDNNGAWKLILAKEIKNAGYNIDLNRLV